LKREHRRGSENHAIGLPDPDFGAALEPRALLRWRVALVTILLKARDVDDHSRRGSLRAGRKRLPEPLSSRSHRDSVGVSHPIALRFHRHSTWLDSSSVVTGDVGQRRAVDGTSSSLATSRFHVHIRDYQFVSSSTDKQQKKHGAPGNWEKKK